MLITDSPWLCWHVTSPMAAAAAAAAKDATGRLRGSRLEHLAKLRQLSVLLFDFLPGHDQFLLVAFRDLLLFVDFAFETAVVIFQCPKGVLRL